MKILQLQGAKILELPVVEEGSDVDSMPELEDETNLESVEIP